MFSFRRKPKKPEETLRTSPSLPDLKNMVQGEIPWPEELVDIAAIRRPEADEEIDSIAAMTEATHVGGEGNRRPSVASILHQGATRVSFSTGREPVMFHKPFFRNPEDSSSRTGVPTQTFASTTGEAVASAADGTNAPISSFYMSMATPPEALNLMRKKYGKKEKTESLNGSRTTQRRAKIPPTFNIMVVGGKGTGKSSLLRLLLETAEISSAATKEQRTALAKFLDDSSKSTHTIQTTSLEISENKFDRIMLSVIDTPGLDFLEGRELKLGRQVNAILRHVDAQYADTMSEESKVVRQQKGDQHIHLCIYMVDPASIISTKARRTLDATSLVPPIKTRSEATISHSRPPDLVPDTSSGDESGEDEDEEGPLTMAPAEIKVIRRISNRSNVLPVIAHADSLTDEKLAAVKEAVRRGLLDAGIGFGVFNPAVNSTLDESHFRKRTDKFASGISDESMSGHTDNGEYVAAVEGVDGDAEGEDEERQSRVIIKLRPPRHRNLSRSRSRKRELSRVAEDDSQPLAPDATDHDSVANVRFSAHRFANSDFGPWLPFALIMPENKRHRRRQKPTSGLDTPIATSTTADTAASTEDSHENQISQVLESALSPIPLASAQSHNVQSKGPFPQGPPADMKGIFIRRFRWGTVDVLDPMHCDFAALRIAVLSTHLKLLKVHTREVLYEKYRTEKLLARRATRQISEEQRKRLLEDLKI